MRKHLVMLVLLQSVLLLGCATFKHVVRTVGDLAVVACQLFGEQHPQEFHYLVAQTVPRLPEQKPEFSVAEACAIAEVVQPFVDSQLSLQHQTAASLQLRMRSPDADLPQ